MRANYRFARSEVAFDEALPVAPSPILRQYAHLERSFQRHYKNPNPKSRKAPAESSLYDIGRFRPPTKIK